MKTLVLGTCRIRVPCKHIDDIVIFRGGATASLGQTIQAVKVMKREDEIPKNLYSQVCAGKTKVFKSLENEIINFNEIDKVVLEVASLHNRYVNVDGRKIYVWKELCESCLTDTDTQSSMLEKLMAFCDFFPNRKMLLVPFPVRGEREDREMISETLKIFACKNNYDYFDPLKVVKEYGESMCLKASRHGVVDHYTKFMNKLVRDRVSTFINKDRRLL